MVRLLLIILIRIRNKIYINVSSLNSEIKIICFNL